MVYNKCYDKLKLNYLKSKKIKSNEVYIEDLKANHVSGYSESFVNSFFINTSSSNASFTNLTANSYTFLGCNVRIANNAGFTNQQTNAIAIGCNAGMISQGSFSIAIGSESGRDSQQDYNVAIGYLAGNIGQGGSSISIGTNAGQFNQLLGSISIGAGAGTTNQGQESIAIGSGAGSFNQANNSIAFGTSAGLTGQSTTSIAIGNEAGLDQQGQYCIAIGNYAGRTNQANNSIVINADASDLAGQTASSFYVNPIRSVSNPGAQVMCYDTTNKEIYNNTGKTFVINHPLKEDKYLVHACLEGPESGVYYRGEGQIINNSFTEIKLPNYVEKLATDFTIQLTQIFNGKVVHLSTSKVFNNEFKVYGENTEFYYTVFGKRGMLNVEPDKRSVALRGDGPYKYII